MSSRLPSPICPRNTPSIAAASRRTSRPTPRTGAPPLHQHGAKQGAGGSSIKGRYHQADAAITTVEKEAWSIAVRMRMETEMKARSQCILCRPVYHFPRALLKAGVLVPVQRLASAAVKQRVRQQ
jgi:hypothetical protein